MNKRKKGAEYEEKAASWLRQKGYEILCTNYRNAMGEIDIIALSPEGELCYTEVKYRSSGRSGDPLEAVNQSKQKVISRVAACHYAHFGRKEDIPCRFDVIGVYEDGRICHLENAFDYQGGYLT